VTDTNDAQGQLKQIEESIEDALWTSVQDEDYTKALKEYERAKGLLESFDSSDDTVEMERKRILSYCLMRINDALGHLEQSEGSTERAEESLRLAEESEDRVQILRSKLALGVNFLNLGELQEAEKHFTDIILQSQDETENRDVIQVYGWTLIVRVNILLGKSLYDQAKELANQALGVLSGIDNYAGLRMVCSLLSRIYQIEGDNEQSELFRERAEDYTKAAKEHRQ
jgi:tetratricopeptide (TPR) repeat protein